MKTALVTGGARRIGKAISLKLAAMGYNIALHYHSSSPAMLVKEIQSLGVKCVPLRCDLSDGDAAASLVRRAAEELPPLELLVNSASIFERSHVAETSEDVLDSHIEINLKSPFRLSRDFSNIAQRGQIINIIDANAVKNNSPYAAYLISKKGLLGLTEMCALEFAPGLRVNAIAPGLILPPAGKGKEYMIEAAEKRVPLKHQGSLEDITRALEFLVKNEFITGQILFIDGGEHLR